MAASMMNWLTQVCAALAMGSSVPQQGGTTQTLTRRRCLQSVAATLTGSMLLPSELTAEVVRSGTNSRDAHDEAVAALPLTRMTAAARTKTNDVVRDHSLYRQLPTEMLHCDPELYLFFVNRPETVVNIWEVLRISDVRLRQTGANSYRGDDGRGTVTDFEFLYRSQDKHVIYGEGNYEGPLLGRRVRGTCILFLRTRYLRDESQAYYISHQLDAFVKLESLGAEVMARTLQRTFGQVADRNFSEVSQFVANLSRKTKEEPEWALRMARELDRVHPTVRQDFVDLTSRLSASTVGAAGSPGAAGSTERR